MSESINNREYRQKVIKQVIEELHAGKTVEDVKHKFEAAFAGVSAAEISEAEQALINDGLPVSEVQRLCDVHSAVFKGSIAEIHSSTDKSDIPGHPTNILKLENRAVEQLIVKEIDPYLGRLEDKASLAALKEGLNHLSALDLHYSKKENLFFPYLERYGITAPPKVMWGEDDEIREHLGEVSSEIHNELFNPASVLGKLNTLKDKIVEMIFKEENILVPMLLETLTQDEWKRIADEMSEIGFCLLDAVPEWTPVPEEAPAILKEIGTTGVVTLPTGVLKIEELAKLLDTLPFDITFVDKNDTVKYFSQSAERIFPRTKAIIGRDVSNCHPPASVHIVEKIVEDFKSGAKNSEDFWINMGEKFILIRYFAVRDDAGDYIGVLEVTQDIKPIQGITGEKRLMS